jgi:predicted metalloendopeptidase
LRRAYLACIAELLTLAGAPDGARRAADVLSLETQIARRQWSPERLRDRRANIHVMSVQELQRFRARPALERLA